MKTMQIMPFAYRLALAGALLLGAVAVPLVEARAQLRIDITKATIEPMPIAISDFDVDSPQAAQAAVNVPRVIRADLERSGLFKPLDPKSHIQKPEDMRTQPRFQDWRVINAQALVTGRIEMQADGRLRAEFRLWDIFAEQQLTGLVFFSTPENWRRVAHIIADAIYKRLTGEDGYFDTRVVYVSESGPANARRKRLAIMDQDGENNKFLTTGDNLVLTPRFNPARFQQEITYLAYPTGRQAPPRVYLFNIDTGQQELVGTFAGMTFAPRFAPDGNSVIMSYAKEGTSNIFRLDLRNRREQQITNDPSINTSPSFSPDGARVTFNSDRSGGKQIYVMNADGSNQQRISFGQGGQYSTPVWSPRGDLIAFTKEVGGKFEIGVMRPDGSGERILSSSNAVQEAPTWAPNGRVLMFFREQPGRTRIWSIDLTGGNEREVITPTDASDPAWSPLSPLVQ